jgi:hypothetical protein
MRFAVFLLSALLLPGTALAAAKASSYHKSRRDPADYSAASAVDNDLETVWLEGGDGPGLGQWIVVDLPRGTLQKIGVAVGFQGDKLKKYSRPTKLKVEILKAEDTTDRRLIHTQELSLEDKPGLQEFTLSEPISLATGLFGGAMKFTILEVKKGDDFEECAIAEVAAFYEQMTAPTMVIDNSTGTATALDAADEVTSTAWVADGTTDEYITVEASGWTVSGVGVLPGHAKSWKKYARIKEAEFNIAGMTWTHTFDDTAKEQLVPFPRNQGISAYGYGELVMKVKSVYSGDYAQVAVSEIKLRAIAFDGP